MMRRDFISDSERIQGIKLQMTGDHIFVALGLKFSPRQNIQQTSRNISKPTRSYRK